MKNNLFFWILYLNFIAGIGNANASSSDLVINGGFENGASGWIFSGNSQVVSGNTYAGHGWTDSGYANGNVALFGAGDQSGGSVSQIINTVIGQKYKLTFDYGAITGNGRPQNLNVWISGNKIMLNSRQITAYGTSQLANLMTNNEMIFTANSTRTYLKFADANIVSGNSIDAVIDNISVTLVGSNTNSTNSPFPQSGSSQEIEYKVHVLLEVEPVRASPRKRK